MQNDARTKAFVSYSHKDARYLERLLVHLAFLEREGLIDVWDDTKIFPGTVWLEEINRALVCAKVAILLISADFLASKFIAENELPPLLAAAKSDGATILSVILSPCRFVDSQLSQFQAVNNPSKPLRSMTSYEKEMVWDKVARAVKELSLGLSHAQEGKIENRS